jgi:hypothetical protein
MIYFDVVEVMPCPDLRGAVKPLSFKTVLRNQRFVLFGNLFGSGLKSQVSDREFPSSGFCVVRSGSCE